MSKKTYLRLGILALFSMIFVIYNEYKELLVGIIPILSFYFFSRQHDKQ